MSEAAVSRDPTRFLERCGLKRPVPRPYVRLDVAALKVLRRPVPDGVPPQFLGRAADGNPPPDRAGFLEWPPTGG